MTHILFGQSYYLRFDPKLCQAMQPYPPLGTLYAAAYLRARGYEVAFFDAMLAESEGSRALIASENSLSESLMSMKLEKYRLDRIPDILQQMMKPVEKISCSQSAQPTKKPAKGPMARTARG